MLRLIKVCLLGVHGAHNQPTSVWSPTSTHNVGLRSRLIKYYNSLSVHELVGLSISYPSSSLFENYDHKIL